ncbi:MAG: cation:proton antiporter, partial [Balneolaceae bacterium]
NDTSPFEVPFSDPVLIFAVVMLVILLAPLAIKRLKIPGLVGLILAGALVGPSLLGFLERDSTIDLLGTVGLLYLMFMAGLSIDLNQFEKLRNKSIGFGLLSFSLPMGGAYLMGVHLLGFSGSTSLLLGSIVGSHTLLAYPIAERLGITKNIPVTMALGGTLVTDTLSLGVLAVIAASSEGQTGIGYWIMFASQVALFITAAILIIPRLARWFFRNVKYENNTDFVFMVAVLFTTAFLAEVAGLASIIGAFFAGLLLNRFVPGTGTLMSRVQFVGNALFIPFFLISVGMLVDVEVLGSLEVWIQSFLFTLLVFSGKGLAAWLTRVALKQSAEEGWVVFGLTTPQSAATLAVTLVGYDLGFFDSTAVNAVVMMILYTCLVGPWLVEKYGRMVAIQEEEKPYEPSDAPQRILVPLANPETSDALMDIAFMVRDAKSGQAVYPLTVARDGNDVEAQVAKGEKMLSHAVIHAAAAEVPVTPITRVDLNIARGIVRAIRELRISNVIIGWNGEVSTKRRIFGSILDQLLEDLNELVMVSKIERPINTFDRMILAIPPYAALENGFAEAIRSMKLMVGQIGGSLVVVSTEDRGSFVSGRIEKIRPDLDIQYEQIQAWADLPRWLDENRQESDLFVLLSAREGTLSWRPGLDRLPRVIAQRYPELSFITVYPSEVDRSEKRSTSSESNFLLSEERVKIQLDCEQLGPMLTHLLENEPAIGDVEVDRIVKRLVESSDGYNPEVMPGVFLYESHTSKVTEQILHVGISPKGVKVDRAAHPAHLVLLLLSPKEISVQDHLEALNATAKLVHSSEVVESLKKVKDPKEVIRLLTSGRT